MRFRTVDGAIKELRKIDPETAITSYFVRSLILEGKLRYKKSGVKYLINFDSLLEFLEIYKEGGKRNDKA